MHGNLDASQVNEIYGALYYGVYRNYFQGMQFLPSEELYFTYDFPQLFESHNKAAFISSWQHEKKNQLTEMVFFWHGSKRVLRLCSFHSAVNKRCF